LEEEWDMEARPLRLLATSVNPIRKDEWTRSLKVDIGSPRLLLSHEVTLSFLVECAGEREPVLAVLPLGGRSSLRKGITP
jgi:hypothetical protein